jgi:hypothetical protein
MYIFSLHLRCTIFPIKMKYFASVLILFLYCSAASGQKKTVVFGLQLEPVIPSRMFRIQTEDIIKDNVTYSIIPKTGYLLGTHLSVNMSRHFTIETGINLIKRGIDITALDNKQEKMIEFTIHNFEIPLASTFFVRLTQNLYMGQTVGFSFQMLPSHLTSKMNWVDSQGTISKFEQLSIRRNWLIPTFKGGVGFEYRTEENGAFYFGAVYHLFTKLYTTQITYKTTGTDHIFDVKPQSDFFGLMFRYNFPPAPLLNNTKKQKK